MKKYGTGSFLIQFLLIFFAVQGVFAQEIPQKSADYLYQKINTLENQLTEMTGALEQMAYKLSLLEEKIQKENADMTFRLNELEQKTPLTQGGLSSSISPDAAKNSLPVSTNTPTESENLSKTQEAAQPEQADVATSFSDPKEMYDDAYQFLVKTEYETAQEKLAAFLQKFPDHPLAGNAKYWLGETYYVRGLYEQAAVQFADGFQKYKTNVKGADNLLKLGMSMQKLDKKTEACTAFRNLKKEFPKASSSILQKAQDEAKKLKCRP